MTAKRDFLTLADVPAEAWPALWDRTWELERDRDHAHADHVRPFDRKTLALVFEKASTRTRVSFEVAATELGGASSYLSSDGSQLGRGEPVADTARVLASYCHAIVVRTFAQARVADFARHAAVPVINGLSDQHHPCQVATDLYTVRRHFGDLAGRTYAWIGDGNNMANSWIEAAGMFGLDLRLACPDGYLPDAGILQTARTAQRALGRGSITLTTEPREAAAGAHVISTDVWASMGQEAEAARRRAAFAGYCVDAALLAHAAPDGIVLHCLPAHRGEEITGDVLDGPRSLAWVQAANRLHVAKAVLEWVMQPRAA
ncbi:MAG: ornithine carbamoyltransferase [Deltaproteobacteria bacterium]|nr:ornithine carbamoyltransferase [Deltaproteobacteria bacterium]